MPLRATGSSKLTSESKLKFPEDISATSLCPDTVLTLESTKQVVLLELTAEEEANQWRRAKYVELVMECRCYGWKASGEPVEVGCRGFAGQSLH